MDRQDEAGQAVAAGGVVNPLTALAFIAGISILVLGAIVLKMLADGRERMRLLAPQIRVVSPPKEQPERDKDAQDKPVNISDRRPA